MKARSFVLLLGSLALVAGSSNPILGDDSPEQKPPEGFTAIFDGKDLNGWEGSPGVMKITDFWW